MKRKLLLAIFIFILIIGSIALAVFVYFRSINTSSNSEKPSDSVNSYPISIAVEQPTEKFKGGLILLEGEIYTYDKDKQETKQLTNTGKNVNSLVVAKDGTKFAYGLRDKVSKDCGYKNEVYEFGNKVASSIYEYDLNTNTHKVVMAGLNCKIKSVGVWSKAYSDAKPFAYNDNGTKLLFRHNGVSIFDLDTKNTKVIDKTPSDLVSILAGWDKDKIEISYSAMEYAGTRLFDATTYQEISLPDRPGRAFSYNHYRGDLYLLSDFGAANSDGSVRTYYIYDAKNKTTKQITRTNSDNVSVLMVDDEIIMITNDKDISILNSDFKFVQLGKLNSAFPQIDYYIKDISPDKSFITGIILGDYASKTHGTIQPFIYEFSSAKLTKLEKKGKQMNSGTSYEQFYWID